jgi:ribosomal protein L34E
MVDDIKCAECGRTFGSVERLREHVAYWSEAKAQQRRRHGIRRIK